MLSHQIMALWPQNKFTRTHISDMTNLQPNGEQNLGKLRYKSKSSQSKPYGITLIYITENTHTLIRSFWTPDGAINILFLWNKQAEKNVILFT